MSQGIQRELEQGLAGTYQEQMRTNKKDDKNYRR
jgi:hypothetical protein